MIDFVTVVGILLFIVCLTFVIIHSLRMKRITLLDWSVLGIGGIYGIGWVIVARVTVAGGNPTWGKWILPYEYFFPVHTASAIILLGGMWFGWIILGSIKIIRYRMGSAFILENDTPRLVNVMWLLLIVAFIMQWLYSRAYGGFLGLLDYSRLIRSAIFPIENPLSFLRSFGGLALFASYGFFALWIGKCRRLSVLVGLFLSVLFSLYILYSWLGRIGFLTYLMTFVLGAFLYRKPRPLSLLFFGSLVLTFILVGAYFVSIWFNLKAAENLSFFLARELSFPFASFFAQLNFKEHLFRLFKDFFYIPAYLLPSSLWSNWIEDVSQINTALIMGAPKGERGVTGGIPVDLITLGLMQASVFGILVVGVIFGAFLRLIQHFIDKIDHLGMRAVFESHIAIKIAVLGLFYAQPAQVVSGNFALLVTVIVILLYLKKPKFRKVTQNKIISNMETVK